jgi:predicted ABC-type ATPase
MATDFSKYGQPINEKTGVPVGATDFSKYGTPVSKKPLAEKGPGMFQSFVQSAASPFLKTAASGITALGTGMDLVKSIGQKIGGKGVEAQQTLDQSAAEVERRKAEGYDFGYFGKVKPLGSVKEAIGAGAEMGSYLVGGYGATGAIKEGIKQQIINAIKTGIKYESVSGALMFGGAEAQSPDSTLKSIGIETTKGGAFGATTGLVGGAVTPVISKAVKFANPTMRETMVRGQLGQVYRESAAKYVKPQAILDTAEMVNKTDPIGVLQMYGKNTLPDMVGNGASTVEGQEFLWKKIGELSKLKQEDLFLSDARVSIEAITDYTDALIEAQPWSGAKKAAEKKQALKVLAEIGEGYKGSPLYQDGIELIELDKLKTEQAALSKSYKNPNAKFSYDAHSMVGKAAKEIIEGATESDTIRDLNKLIQGHYDAIDFLDALNGKKVNGGALSRMFMKLTGDVVGLTVGQSIGHPILGTALGHAVSNKVADVVQSEFISNPMKRLLIQNLGEQTPKEVAAVLKTLKAKYKDIYEEMGLDLVQSLLSKKTKLSTSKTIIPTSKSANNSINVVNGVTGEKSVLDLTPTVNKKPKDIIAGKVPDVKSSYPANRLELHNKIADDIYKEGAWTGKSATGEDVFGGKVKQGKRLDLVIGPPASGKSEVLVNPLSKKFQSLVIDSDRVKVKLPEYDGGKGAKVVHRESNDILEGNLLIRAMKNGDNIVLPTVGAKMDKLQIIIDKAKANGYDVHLSLNQVSPEIALQRAKIRAKATGREIPTSYITTEVGNKPFENYNALRTDKRISSFTGFNNEVPKGTNPALFDVTAKSSQLDDIVTKAKALTKKNGGVTIALNGDIPTKGFSVADSKLTEKAIPQKDLTKEAVRNYVLQNLDNALKSGRHLGMWVDEGKVYFDIPTVFNSKSEAIKVGNKADQIGIFDLESFETIYLKKPKK